MAEGILRKLLDAQDRGDDFIVESAGTASMSGSPASRASVEVSSEHGIDLSGHVSREITSEIIGEADLILTMDEGHRQRVVALCPDAAAKSFVITQYGGSHEGLGGVPDPIGLSKDEYLATFHEIEASIRAAMPKILALSESGTEEARKRAD